MTTCIYNAWQSRQQPRHILEDYILCMRFTLQAPAANLAPPRSVRICCAGVHCHSDPRVSPDHSHRVQYSQGPPELLPGGPGRFQWCPGQSTQSFLESDSRNKLQPAPASDHFGTPGAHQHHHCHLQLHFQLRCRFCDTRLTSALFHLFKFIGLLSQLYIFNLYIFTQHR